MDFTYNDEQRMLTDSVRKLVSDAWTFEARRARASTAGLDRTAWGALAELGVAGLLVPQEYDGFGESPATLIIEVSDNGPGISATNAARVFEPFFTTARAQGGTGLGLAVVKSLVNAHRGAIELVDSAAGTRVRISLPLTTADRSP